MKRLDIVQLSIIIVGIFVAYIFFSSAGATLFSALAWVKTGMTGGELMEYLLSSVILCMIYFLIAWFCIKQSKPIANWICEKGDFTGEVNFSLDKQGMIYVIFIALGIYGIVLHLPRILVDGFNRIRNSNVLMPDESVAVVSSSEIAVRLLSLLMYFVLVFYAGVFADYFSAKISNVEPEDTINEKPQDN